MGSFNVSCSLSGKSISGEVVFIPLVKNHIIKRLGDNNGIFIDPSNYLCFNEDTHPLCPAALPIFGTYYDYGYITVDPSPLDGYFKQAYGVDCQTFVDIVTERVDGEIPIADPLYGIYIDRIVWDEMLSFYDSFHSIDKDLWPTPYELDQLGFVIAGTTGLQRYKTLYQHPTINPSFGIGSDGHFLQVLKMEDSKWVLDNHPLYKIKDLKRLIESHNSQIDFSILGSKYRVAQIKSYIGETITDSNRFQEDLHELLKHHHNIRWIFGGYNHEYISKLCLNPLLTNDAYIVDKVSELYAMHDIFMCCGRVFMPTYLGLQCGAPEYTKALGQALVKSSDQMLKDRNY